MSWFKKIEEEDDTIIVRGDENTIRVKDRLYRKRPKNQDGFYHWWLDLMPAECNLIYVGKSFWYEVKKHPCYYNCPDSGQSTEEWITRIKSLPEGHFMKKRIIQILEARGLLTNQPTKWRLN